MDIFYFVLYFSIILLVLLEYFRAKLRPKYHENLPPGPKGLPIIGHTILVHRNYEKMTELGKKFGGLFSLHLFRVRFAVLSDWKTIKAALVEQNEIFSGRSQLYVMQQVTQFNDISMSYGPEWKQKKMKVIQILRNCGFGKTSLQNGILDQIAKLFQVVDTQDGKPVEISKLFFIPVLNVIWNIVAGTMYEHDDRDMMALKRRIQLHLSLLTSTMPVNALPWLRFLPFDPFGFHKLKRNLRKMQRYLESIIQEHKKRFHHESEPQDFIDHFLAENADKETMQNGTNQTQFLSGVIFNLLIAGIETTKSTLEYGLMYMARWPHIMKKVQHELDTVIGSERKPTYSHVSLLPYTNATILEIHRFTSILPLAILHRVLETTVIRGYTIPKDTLVFPNIYAVHHDKNLWGDPEVFRPERFLDSSGKVQKPEYLMHFGLGNRSCPGISLARMELFLIFTSLLQRYSFENVPDEQIPNLNPISKTSLTRIPKPFRLVVKKR